ncbi:MAG TPA: hypothetical protein EYH07_09345 [Kiloniellaceae bacterium]|nr:hypothetical protein [Kiloniellaceae bacterium]HIP78649.1 hypothetical protein [Kiloniellaceae bacterium]
MDWTAYTDNHTHPSGSYTVEFVAYYRRDSGLDLFAYEPEGSCPELEDGRVDEDHIFLAHLESERELDAAVEAVMARLGAGYEPAVFYREAGSRKLIGKIHTHLQKRGAHHAWVRSNGREDWELVIRRKDFPIAAEVVSSNV